MMMKHFLAVIFMGIFSSLLWTLILLFRLWKSKKNKVLVTATVDKFLKLHPKESGNMFSDPSTSTL